jgi:hypothetical protein
MLAESTVLEAPALRVLSVKQNLGSEAGWIYFFLAQLKPDSEGNVSASYAEIELALGIKRPNISRAIQVLVDDGRIRVIEEGHQHIATKYKLD